MTARLLALCLLLLTGATAHAQETYDVITFAAPRGWAREDRPGSVLAFTQKDGRSGAWARVAIYRSTTGAGSLASDFGGEWESLVAKPLGTGAASQTSDAPSQDGWSRRTGTAQFTFEKRPAFATLTTVSNGARRASILVIANSNAFQGDIDRFMSSVRIDAPVVRADAPAAAATESRDARAAPGNPNAMPSVIGR